MRIAALSGWTSEQKHVVAASFLGWTLDAFDFFLMVFVLKDIAKEFGVGIPDVAYALFLRGLIAARQRPDPEAQRLLMSARRLTTDAETRMEIENAVNQAVKELATRFDFKGSNAKIELTKPELGYVKAPWDVYRLEDFTSAQIAKAAEDPSGYSTALVFSTKEEPAVLPFHLNSPKVESEYFGLHQDMSAPGIASQLNGELVWEHTDELEWAALIRFHRSVEAELGARPGVSR